MKSYPSSSVRLLAFGVVAAAVPAAPCSAQSRFERISVSSSGAEADGALGSARAIVSADGRHVAFETYAANLSPWDINGTQDVYVRDRVAGTTTLISTALTGLSGNNASFLNAMSADGRFVVFASTAYDIVKFDTNGQRDLFVHDRDPDGNGTFDEGNETLVRVNVDGAGAQADGDTFGASISDDGTKVVFRSDATNLVAGDGNGVADVFLRDLAAGTTERVSVSSAGTEGDASCFEPAITGDGTFVLFASDASNLAPADGNGRRDLFGRDLVAGTTERLSLGEADVEGNADAFGCSISADGTLVVFSSSADNLVAGDGNGASDVFLRDRTTGITTCLSLAPGGAMGDAASQHARLSRNGRFVVFDSDASDLAGVETNGAGDVFVRDLLAGTLHKVSVEISGEEGEGGSSGHDVSDDGLTVALVNHAADLIGGDGNGLDDLLVRDRNVADLEATWLNYGAGWPGKNGVPELTPMADPVLGTTIDVLVGNSAGFYVVGFLYVGVVPVSIPTKLGGTLLVDPLLTFVFLVDLGGTIFTADIPLDDSLAGVSIFAQALEFDDAASKGVSFTPGLELILGQ